MSSRPQLDDATQPDDAGLVDLRCSALIYRGDSVLLCRRSDNQDYWSLPGGTPRYGEGTAAAAAREVAEETGLIISADRVAFVLEASSWDREQHRIEIVFRGTEASSDRQPRQLEGLLEPAFVPLTQLSSISLRPPIGGYIRGLFYTPERTAAYLGNLWRNQL